MQQSRPRRAHHALLARKASGAAALALVFSLLLQPLLAAEPPDARLSRSADRIERLGPPRLPLLTEISSRRFAPYAYTCVRVRLVPISRPCSVLSPAPASFGAVLVIYGLKLSSHRTLVRLLLVTYKRRWVWGMAYRGQGPHQAIDRFIGGVRDAGGTPYAGGSKTWLFTTSDVFVTGGQVHPERFHLEIPVDGRAKITADAGAMPSVVAGSPAWSVWSEIEGPVDPVKDTLPANTDGSIVYMLGHPPAFPVTIASKVWVHVIDPTGTEAATFRLGPFVTPDRLGFVAQPGEETTVTTVDQIQVTVPAAAFTEPTLVRITKKDPTTLGVPITPGLKVGALIDIDFAGEASETLRVRIPVQTTAPAGTIVFAGEPFTVPWGPRLKMVDLATIVDGPNGTKLISSYAADQPTTSSGRAYFLGAPDTGVSQQLLQTTLGEIKNRQTTAFLSSETSNFVAMFGQFVLGGASAQYATLYNILADTFLYIPLPQNWSGSFILPVLLNTAPTVVMRDLATGWVLGSKTYDPVTGAGSLIPVPEFPPQGAIKRPTLVGLTPFDVIRFRADELTANASSDSCQRLRLEIEACAATGGTLKIKPVEDFPLPEGTWVELYKLEESSSKSDRRQVSGHTFTELTVQAGPDDELVLIVAQSDIEPQSLGSFLMSFEGTIEKVAKEKLDCAGDVCLVTLTDKGPKEAPSQNVKIPVKLRQETSSTITIELLGTLPAGHAFVLKVDDTNAIAAKNDKGELLFYPSFAPKEWTFQTRAAVDEEIGAIGGDKPLGDTNVARDMLKFGNLLLVASGTGKLVALDVSNITRPLTEPPGKPFAVLNGAGDQIRAMATDGHGRVFYNVLLGSLWTAKAVRLEDVRRATTSKCPETRPADWQGVACFDPVLGGVRTALGIGTTSSLLASDFFAFGAVLPTGQPVSMELLVADETNPPKLGAGPPNDTSPKQMTLQEFNGRYGNGNLPSADSAGFYPLALEFDSTKVRKPDLKWREDSSLCTGEKAWDHYQRVTVDNLTTGQSWSFDIQNAWDIPDNDTEYQSAGGHLSVPQSAGVKARLGDKLRVRFNLRAFGYVAIVGSGITVLDLNRAYRGLVPGGALTASKAAQCGRRLDKLEGKDFTFPKCPSDSTGTTLSFGLASTTSVGVLPGAGTFTHSADGTAAIYTAQNKLGAVHSTHVYGVRPGQTFNDPNAPNKPTSYVEEAACLVPKSGTFPIGVGPFFRDIAIARRATWYDRGIEGDQDYKFEVKDPAKSKAPVTVSAFNPDGSETPDGSDLAFVSLGQLGIAVFDLRKRSLGAPPQLIGRFYKKGHWCYRLAVDQSGRYLFAGGTSYDKSLSGGEPVIDVWDISRVNGGPDTSTNEDPRLLSSIKAPWDTNHVIFDETGTGLLYTWGNGGDEPGGKAVPVADPEFVFGGLYRPDKDPTDGSKPLPVSRVTARLAPLGTPLYVKSKDENDPEKRKVSERVGTAAFKVRLSLPGDFGEKLSAKVQSLRALPDERLRGKEEAGGAVAMPGGPGWPANEVFVTLVRVGKSYATDDANDKTGGSGRLSVAFNEYESKEIVLLLADPRARGEYWKSRQQLSGDETVSQYDEESQCRRCDKPEYLKALIEAGTISETDDIKELLAGGPWVRALLSIKPLDPNDTQNQPPQAAKADTEKAIKRFEGWNKDGDVYRAPSGVVALTAWADEVPSPIQVSMAEPILSAAAWDVGEAGASLSLVSGEALLSATDHFVAGRGLDFALSRTYRSGFLGYSPFGSAAWSSPLLAHIRQIPPVLKPKSSDEGASNSAKTEKPKLLYPGELQYHDGAGHVLRFYPTCEQTQDAPCPDGYEPPVPPETAKRCPKGWEADGESSYCMPEGLYVRLRKLAKGWQLLGREHDAATFDEEGKLVELADRFKRAPKNGKERGSSLALSYDGFGQLTKVRDDYGRGYRLTYEADPRFGPQPGGVEGSGKKYGLLKKVEDFFDRKLEYVFDDDGNRLLSKVKLPEVTNPVIPGHDFTGTERPTIEYVYDARPRQTSAPLNGQLFSKSTLTAVKLPKYLESVSPAPERIRFDYDDATGRVKSVVLPTGDETTVKTFKRELTFTPSSEVKPPTLVELKAPWNHTASYTLDEHGRTKTIEDKESIDLFQAPTDETALPPATPTLTAGRAKTELHYEDDGRLESITHPSGAKTTFTYRKVDDTDEKGKDRLTRGEAKERLSSFGPDGDKGLVTTYYTQPVTVTDLKDNLPAKLQVGFGSEDADAAKKEVSTGTPGADNENGTTTESVHTGFTGNGVGAKLEFEDYGRPTKKVVADLPNPIPNTPKLELKSAYGKYPTAEEKAGFLEKLEIATGNTKETYFYDDDKKTKRGNVTKIETSFGAVTTRKYDEWDRVIEEVSGKSTGSYRDVSATSQVAYDAAGHVVTERRKQGELDFVTTTRLYNAREQLLEVKLDKVAATAADGGTPSRTVTLVRYKYDDQTGQLLSVTTGKTDSEPGVTTEYSYDSAGRLSSTREKGASDTSGERKLAYDVAGNLVYLSDGDEGATFSTFDSLGRPYLTVLPTGARIERLYDQADRVTKETVKRKEKDPGDPTKTVTTTLSEITSEYEPYGLSKRTETIATDPAGLEKPGGRRETRLEYDAAGRVVDVYAKDPADPQSERHLRQVRFKNDDTGRIDWEKDAFGNQTVYEIPDDAPFVNAVTLIEAGPNIIRTRTTFDRDALGRAWGETRGDGTRIERTLDEAGNLLSLFVDRGNEVRSLYDGRGLPVSVTRMATGQSTLFGYDAGSRLLERKVIGRSGGPDTTKLQYDTIGRLWHRTQPGSFEETFGYYPDGTTKRWTTRLRGKDGGAQVPILFTYDAANNLKTRKVDPAYPSASIPTGLARPDAGDAFTYDSLSRLLTASIKSGPGEGDVIAGAKVTIDSYDRRGLAKNESVGAWGSPITRTYDVWGNATGLTYPSVSASPTAGFAGITRTFDTLDRPTSAAFAGGTGQAIPGWGADYTWGGVSRLLSTTTRGEAALAHKLSYTGTGSRLSEIAYSALGTSLGKLGFTWDAAKGEKSARTAGGAGARQLDALQGAGWSFGHDAAQRMWTFKSGAGSATSGGTGSWSYSYGAADELKRIEDFGAKRSEPCESGAEGKLTKRGEIVYTYDDEGRRVGDDRGLYTWDWRGRLAQSDFRQASPVDPGERVLYSYDALGRLLSREKRGRLPEGVTDDAQRPFIEKRLFVWDGQSLLSETGLNYQGTPIWRKQYIPGPGGLDDAVQVRVEDDLTGTPVAKSYVLLRDELGSVVGVAKDELKSGKPQLIARYLYTPFGEAHIETGPEIRKITFDKELKEVDGTAQAPAIEGELFSGGFRVETTIGIDPDTLAEGLKVEKQTVTGNGAEWVAVPTGEIATAVDTKDTPTLQVMRLAGWPKGTSYRIRLTTGLKDGFTRALMIPEAGKTEVEASIVIPPDGSRGPSYEKEYPFVYDSVRAASDTLGGLFPGGQSLLWQGLWRDGATGWGFARARWIDGAGTWTAPDSFGSIDSENLWAPMGLRAGEGVDPLGTQVPSTGAIAEMIEKGATAHGRRQNAEFKLDSNARFARLNAAGWTMLGRIGGGPLRTGEGLGAFGYRYWSYLNGYAPPIRSRADLDAELNETAQEFLGAAGDIAVFYGVAKPLFAGLRGVPGAVAEEVPRVLIPEVLPAAEEVATLKALPPAKLEVVIARTYQRYYTEAAIREVRRFNLGRTTVPQGTTWQQILGQRIDKAARDRLRAFLERIGVEEGPDLDVRVNRWLRDPAGSGAYRIPDVMLMENREILDGTIGRKTLADPQMIDMGTYSGGFRLTIVRPESGPLSVPR